MKWDINKRKIGLVSSIHEPAQLVDEAVKMGNKIASFSKPIGKNNTEWEEY